MHLRESFSPCGIAKEPRWSPVAQLASPEPAPPLRIAILRPWQALAYQHGRGYWRWSRSAARVSRVAE